MNNKIKKVVIAGGGTSGWITANYLSQLIEQVEIVLVESEEIGIIGVGEGTFPTIRRTMQAFGVDEQDLVNHCEATFKQAIKFVNWMKPQPGEENNFYYHLFDVPRKAPNLDLSIEWLKDQSVGEFASSVSAQARNCDLRLSPRYPTDRQYESEHNYAYHLDAKKMAAFLAKKAQEKGIQRIEGKIVSVSQNAQGDISALHLESGQQIEGDLFVDCTGFKALIIGETLNVPFESKADNLFVDHALTIQIPYESEQQDIESATITTAQTAGWIWDIGLQSRRGVGYVYSSKHISHEAAKKELCTYLGKDSSAELDCRLVKMNVGYRREFWHKNCVSIGLAQGFLEPLESTAIVMIEAAAHYLLEKFPHDQQSMAVTAQRFNDSFKERWDSIVDFVKLHYVLSDREEPFWVDNRKEQGIPTSLQDKLAGWKYHPPSEYDFSINDIFAADSYSYILYGMGYGTETPINRLSSRPERDIESFKSFLYGLSKDLPSHRSYINSVKQFGIQKL
ncbi:tryptophan halogenase family protein [Pseudoalteromonas umbrosa]|uniref:tryptophan halogenase family protein n=1 Tax=Pseudoalteromonas umbrosa TaxID=3048489 RepID=UPI0024C242EB|nr:tryptophan 7-halogenase [Pseudoalteromonas sp. B95]MDK1286036.1 tryptophan 7-halogenase [Pseudoalteromonas sp. B95]